MAKNLAVLMIHGMGDVRWDDFQEQVKDFRDDVKKEISPATAERIAYIPIFFQDILQDQQDAVYAYTQSEAKIDWTDLRKFVLFGFSDAASLESRAHERGSVYEQAQDRILVSLDVAYDALENEDDPVIIVAQSLGGQVISNYIWDSQRSNPSQGIWSGGRQHGAARGSNWDKFRRLRTLRALFTTGCNIPLFVAGKRSAQAVRTQGGGYDFEWQNYYDRDDVLGWPLKPLRHFHDPSRPGMSYGDAVTADHEINASGSIIRWLTRSWNPFSHSEYWEDGDVIRAVAQRLQQILGP